MKKMGGTATRPGLYKCDACRKQSRVTVGTVFESSHGKLKQLIRPVRVFKTLKTAYATIKGFEVMRALRKGQASAFNITGDIRGEARSVERAFGQSDPIDKADPNAAGNCRVLVTWDLM